MRDIQRAKLALAYACEQTADALTGSLRKSAVEQGWPSDVVSGLHVEVNRGKFTYHADDDVKDRVLDLEYGTVDTEPQPVIRKHANRAELAVGSRLASTAWKFMGAMK